MAWIEFDSLTGDPLLDCDYEAEMWYRKQHRERMEKLRLQRDEETKHACAYPAMCVCEKCNQRFY